MSHGFLFFSLNLSVATFSTCQGIKKNLKMSEKVGLMSSRSLAEHWDDVYTRKNENQVSWYQERPEISLKLIKSIHVGPNDGIVDIGGGASALADVLLQEGFENVTVLDISSVALKKSQDRLGKDKASLIKWVVEDVTKFKGDTKFRVWHDRAVLHFLSGNGDKQHYLQSLKQNLVDGGYFIVGAFAVGGATECSGLMGSI